MRKRVDIVWGRGKGRTPISAYDAALAEAGISDFNLMVLSSVLPPDASIREIGRFEGHGIGQVLPVVVAKAVGEGHQVAGLGWVRSPQGGLLHEASGSAKDCVITEIKHGLKDMMRKRSWDFSEISFKIVESDSTIGCALVAAVFAIPRPQFLEWFLTSPATEEVHPGE